MLLIVNTYGGFMEGLEGKEERSFPHVLCWQYGSSSLRQMVRNYTGFKDPSITELDLAFFE